MMIIVDIIRADATISIRRPVAKRPIIPRVACSEARHRTAISMRRIRQILPAIKNGSADLEEEPGSSQICVTPRAL